VAQKLTLLIKKCSDRHQFASLRRQISTRRYNSTILTAQEREQMSAKDWADELIEWADKNSVEQYHFVEDEQGGYWKGFPRDKQTLLTIAELYFWNWNKQLTELPESIGNLTNLMTLKLMCHQLIKLPESIGNLTNLTWLALKQNKLAELPESIGNLTHLQKLNLYNNKLTKLPESIGNLTNLTEIII
jgi:internalin A